MYEGFLLLLDLIVFTFLPWTKWAKRRQEEIEKRNKDRYSDLNSYYDTYRNNHIPFTYSPHELFRKFWDFINYRK